MNIVILGAGTSGTLFAQELRKIDKSSKIILIEESKEFNYSPCSLPYYLSNEISYECLFNEADLKFSNIELINPAKAVKIDSHSKKAVYEKDGETHSINYDKLILALGAKHFIPKIEGLKNPLTFSSINDAKMLKEKIKGKKAKIAIIGAGYIGCELSDSLSKSGHQVFLIDRAENILNYSISPQFSIILKEELEKNGARVIMNAQIKSAHSNEIMLSHEKISCDLIVVCAGTAPNIDLAKQAGIKTNKGIIVDDYLQTSEKDIYAIGDCAEFQDFFNEPRVCGLASTAHKMAKALANNMQSSEEAFASVNSGISKIGNLVFGSAGKKRGEKDFSAAYKSSILKECISKDWIMVKIIANSESEIIGCEAISTANISSSINLLSLAIKKRLKLKDLIGMNNCYNPMLSRLFDPISVACHACLKKMQKKL
ncbi:MAG: FAD-dependent oxidoreductase [Candidatus Nanoarchaeia archaeon]|nr:FAD-dependent oxidoreductase [Candidatus Nanoarchaeia archaeon]MDD5053772.1 FAD-dependent oxidoreductase [Candidatus Nanoarchaeia archaeon]MDD5499387.1 FAD-dependent oxidoreductase [Candidatus Nanoarchaeia archaeon]